jgi:hypothetical protein
LLATIDSGSLVDAEVAFAPSSEGYLAAVLEIESNDPNQPVVAVSLGGVGTAVQPPPMTIEDILAFFDTSLEAGTLQGNCQAGPKCNQRLAIIRLKAFRHMLVAAGTLIEGNYMEWAASC